MEKDEFEINRTSENRLVKVGLEKREEEVVERGLKVENDHSMKGTRILLFLIFITILAVLHISFFIIMRWI